MKTRPIIILGIVAFIGVVAWTLAAFTTMRTVPSEQFADTLRKRRDITMHSRMTQAPQPLPLALRIRFPKQGSRASTGIMMDRSDVFILNSGSGDIECTAHVRGDRVCYVTLTGHSDSDPMRATIRDLFPGVAVDRHCQRRKSECQQSGASDSEQRLL